MSTVSVREEDSGVRVEAVTPHLISLGGSRLSTSVTIHRLSPGSIVLGSGRNVDIAVAGPGVADEHCIIDNINGRITLRTLSQFTTVDGVPVSQPILLTQGCIIGVGHSCLFRFNHPEQAKMIKKSLPVSKPSMLPLSFYQGSIDGNSPHHHQESRSRDALTEVTEFLTKEFSNTDIRRNGDSPSSPVKKSLPSPGYNRNPVPYIQQKPPKYQAPSHNHENHSTPNNERENGKTLPKPKQEVDELALEEILAMCSEYERQVQLEKGPKPQVRIKTNGSLPRDKRLNSPIGVQQSFTFDSSDAQMSEKDGDVDLKDVRKSPHTYENVNFTSGSPRPRIKTFLTKDNNVREQSHEPNTNKIPLVLDFEFTAQSKNSPSNHTYSNLQFLNGCRTNSIHSNSDASDRRDSKGESKEDLRSSLSDIHAKMKYAFLGFDAKKEDSLDNVSSPSSVGAEPSYTPTKDTPTRQHSSPPSWTNPRLELDTFPDYEILNGHEDVLGCSDSNENSYRDGSRSRVENGSRTPTTLAMNEEHNQSPDVVMALREERDLLLKKQTTLKAKVSELELQEQELIRESAVEEALVSGEIAAQDEKLKQDEKRIKILKERTKECEEEMAKCLAQQEESQEHFKMVSDKHNSIIDTLERQIRICGDESLKNELRTSLKEQYELLDAERKSHELLEFQLLEEEAGWLSKREDLQKEFNDATERYETRKTKLAGLKKTSLGLTSNQLELERINHLKMIEEGRNRLKEINEELEKLSSPDCGKRLNETEVVRRRVATSQDDLDRISRVTSGAPMDIGSSNSLGRRTIASLQEIERNRQLHLAKQGSLVIQEERQRVEELKKRVADEVKAQWQQQRNSNCQSFTSVTSEESSIEPTRDSGVSSEEVEKGIHSCEEGKNDDNTNDESVPSGSPESRPLSDISGYSDEQTTIRKRIKSSSNIHRPLTRYLPIRGETLDLRSHIETAGHQVDLCPHISIDSSSCRGYLQKEGLQVSY
uniref:FHA domain-containing protein n=1 Tax=Lygus hesperus TaxID=30085 RepID=A0A0K8S3A8_LYGHE